MILDFNVLKIFDVFLWWCLCLRVFVWCFLVWIWVRKWLVSSDLILCMIIGNVFCLVSCKVLEIVF